MADSPRRDARMAVEPREEPSVATDADQEPQGAQRGAQGFYGPHGQAQVMWSVDVRRYADDHAYRDQADLFVARFIIGASMRSVEIVQDDEGQLWMGALAYQRADRSFRRDATGQLVREGVVVQLPADVELPR